MIYSNPKTFNEAATNEPVILRGAEADAYLESVGVVMYNDHITINEMSMDGITGEKILAENGITLNEDHIVLEGERAKAVKAIMEAEAKKAEEEAKNEDKTEEEEVKKESVLFKYANQ